MRLLRGEAEQITFRRDETLWTGFVWDEYVTWGLFVSGEYSRREVRALLSWMASRGRLYADRDVIVDVGANIGTSSIPFALETSCRVLAIEPVPENLALLRRNIRQNGLEHRITCVPTAISNYRGVIEMVVPETNSGGAEIKQPGSEPSFIRTWDVNKVIEVPTDTLVEILRSLQISPDRVAFVWSDTQGHERQVIVSGDALWLTGVPLYIELWPRGLQLQGGVEPLLNAARKFFDRFVTTEDLLRHESDAVPRPISELPGLLGSLTEDGSTDALLLPVEHHYPVMTRPALSVSPHHTPRG
ncbi:MAG: FkbM family methyltransferase [Candidatus Methylomirabilaceae bacterium]